MSVPHVGDSVNADWLLNALLAGDVTDPALLQTYSTRITAAAQDIPHGEIACTLEGVCVRPSMDTGSQPKIHQPRMHDPHTLMLNHDTAMWHMLHAFVARYRTTEIPGTRGAVLSPRMLRTALYAVAERWSHTPKPEPGQLHDIALHIAQATVSVYRPDRPVPEDAKWAVAYASKARDTVRDQKAAVAASAAASSGSGTSSGFTNGLDAQGYLGSDEDEGEGEVDGVLRGPYHKRAEQMQERFWLTSVAPRTVPKFLAWLLARVDGDGGEWDGERACGAMIMLGLDVEACPTRKVVGRTWRDFITAWYLQVRESEVEITETGARGALSIMPLDVLCS